MDLDTESFKGWEASCGFRGLEITLEKSLFWNFNVFSLALKNLQYAASKFQSSMLCTHLMLAKQAFVVYIHKYLLIKG